MDTEQSALERIANWLETSGGKLSRTQVQEMVEFARSAASSAAQWRPIEAAPKDGTAILVRNDRGAFVVEWNSAERGYEGCLTDWWIVSNGKHAMDLRGSGPMLWTHIPAGGVCEVCEACSGHGEVGSFNHHSPAPGYEVSKCDECGGTGRASPIVTIRAPLPVGVADTPETREKLQRLAGAIGGNRDLCDILGGPSTAPEKAGG